jgi:hypothetical protein
VNFNDETMFGLGDTSIWIEELQDQDDSSKATNKSLVTSGAVVSNKLAGTSHTVASKACYTVVDQHFNSDLAAVKARGGEGGQSCTG